MNNSHYMLPVSQPMGYILDQANFSAPNNNSPEYFESHQLNYSLTSTPFWFAPNFHCMQQRCAVVAPIAPNQASFSPCPKTQQFGNGDGWTMPCFTIKSQSNISSSAQESTEKAEEKEISVKVEQESEIEKTGEMEKQTLKKTKKLKKKNQDKDYLPHRGEKKESRKRLH